MNDARIARKDKRLNDNRRNRWTLRAASAALAGMVLVTGLGPGITESATARKRANADFVQNFTASGPIPFNNGGQPQSLPSTISVSGFETEVADVNITLHNLNFSQADNFDVVLVGPDGRNALVLSDVGSSASNATLALDDQASNQVSRTGPLKSGTFQPTNFGTFADGFFPPGPAQPQGGSRLSVFNSTNPNGTWTIYVRHDPGGLGGAQPGVLTGGWSLLITSANGVPDAAPDTYSAQAGKTLTDDGGVLANDNDPDIDPMTAVLASEPSQGKLQLRPDGSFTYRPGKKAKGIDSFTYLAQDPGGLSDLETATIQIRKAKKKGKR